MSKSIQLKVDESLQECLERIRKEVALDMKKRYNLDEITITGTLASKILACKMNGIKSLNFSIRKIGLNKGILDLL